MKVSHSMYIYKKTNWCIITENAIINSIIFIVLKKVTIFQYSQK